MDEVLSSVDVLSLFDVLSFDEVLPSDELLFDVVLSLLLLESELPAVPSDPVVSPEFDLSEPDVLSEFAPSPELVVSPVLASDLYAGMLHTYTFVSGNAAFTCSIKLL